MNPFSGNLKFSLYLYCEGCKKHGFYISEENKIETECEESTYSR
jgi:hypothetical protein